MGILDALFSNNKLCRDIDIDHGHCACRIPLARQLMCDRVRRASEELRAARTPISTASIAAHLGVAEYLVERAKTDMGLVITGSLDRKLGHDSEGTVADTLQVRTSICI